MKNKIFSVLLSVALIASSFTQVNPVIVAHASPSDVINGDYVLIENENINFTEQTGTINFDDSVVNVTTQTNVAATFDTTSAISSTENRQPTKTYGIGDTKTIAGETYEVVGVGAHCYIWMDSNAKTLYSNPTNRSTAVSSMIDIYDNHSYPVLQHLGVDNKMDYADGSMKLSILIENPATSSDAGHFAFADFENDHITCIHIPLTSLQLNFGGYGALLAHEGQHAFNYSTANNLIWINEGLSVAAMDMYSNGQDNNNYLSDAAQSIESKSGAGLVHLFYTNDQALDYSIPYTFLRYLNAQANHGYKPNSDFYSKFYSAVPRTNGQLERDADIVEKVMAQYPDAFTDDGGITHWTFNQAVENFRIACFRQDATGKYGFYGDQVVKNKISGPGFFAGKSGKSYRIGGTGGIIVKTINGSFTIPDDAGKDVKFIAFNGTAPTVAPHINTLYAGGIDDNYLYKDEPVTMSGLKITASDASGQLTTYTGLAQIYAAGYHLFVLRDAQNQFTYTLGTDVGSTIKEGDNLYIRKATNTVTTFADFGDYCVPIGTAHIYDTRYVPAISASPVFSSATEQNAVRFTITPNNSSDFFNYKISTTSQTQFGTADSLFPSGYFDGLGGVMNGGVWDGTTTQITGADALLGKYVEIFEFQRISGQDHLVGYKQIQISQNNITVPTLNITPTGVGGPTPGSAKLTIVPNTAGDSIYVNPSDAYFVTLPKFGDSPQGTLLAADKVVSGLTQNSYLDVYEVNGSGKVVALTKIDASHMVATNQLFYAEAQPGSAIGSTILALSSNSSVRRYQYVIRTSPLGKYPNIYDAVPSGAISYDYITQPDITGIDTITNKYIDIYNTYDIDGKTLIHDFIELTISDSNIKLAPATPAPAISGTITAVPGSVSASTRLTLTPNTSGETFYVNVLSYPGGTQTPGIGRTPLGVPYQSGDNITGVEDFGNWHAYIDIYEVDGNSKITAFKELTLNFNQMSAPIFHTPIITGSATTGEPTLTVVKNTTADSLAYVVSSTPANVPAYGAAPPAGKTAYTSGNKILGVTATNKYVDIYEYSGSNTYAFQEFILTQEASSAAPTFNTVPTALAGSVQGSTKLTIVPNTTGHAIKVNIVSTPTTTPALGGTPLGSAYTSGTDLTGVDQTKKYVDIYELDGSGKIAAFYELTLSNNKITAPAFNTAASVAEDNSSAYILTAVKNLTGDSLAYLVRQAPYGSFPAIGTSLPSNAEFLTSGQVVPVDSTNKYVDVFEYNGSSGILAFQEIVVSNLSTDASDITILQYPTPGSVVGSTTLTMSKRGDVSSNAFLYIISSTPLGTTPQIGETVPTGGVPYISGSDITGIKAGDYLDIYEVNISGTIVAFSELQLNADDIAKSDSNSDPTTVSAPTLNVKPVISTGSGIDKIKMALTPNSAGDDFSIVISTSAIDQTPSVGDTVPDGSSNYVSLNDIEGLDISVNNYVDIYEVDGSSNIVAFKEVLILKRVTLLGGPVATPGTVANSTCLSLIPISAGNTFKVKISSKAITVLPKAGGTPTGSTYIPGNNITGANPTSMKYLDVYEINSKGKIEVFAEIVLTPDSFAVPTLKSAPSVAPGNENNSTKLTLKANVAGDTFKYVVGSSELASLPAVGGYMLDGSAYTSGSAITGVDSIVNKYIDVYEVDGNSKIVACKEIVLLQKNISAPALQEEPGLKAGSVAKSTILTLAANNAGDTFKVSISSKAITTLPVVGGSASGSTYVSGANIAGVDPTKNKFLYVYEIDSTHKVVAFTQIILTNDVITAPSLNSAPVVAIGKVSNTTKLTLKPNVVGDSFEYAINSASLTGVPTFGDTLPEGTQSYTSGSDISGIDSVNNKYVVIYEVDANSKVVAFKEVVLQPKNISAPALIEEPILSAGSVAKSTILTLTANNAGDKFKVSISTKAITSLPVVGGIASGSAYISGNNLVGVDSLIKKYLYVYEIDSAGKVVAFTQIVLTNDVIKK